MNHKFRVLTLTMIAALVMSALVAVSAQAQFTSNSYPTSAQSSSPLGNSDFKTEAGSVECHETKFIEITAPSSTATASATYSECRAFGFASATVAMNGCDYVFHSNGEVDFECAGSNKVVVTAGACEVQMGTQTGLKSVALTNNGNHIDAKSSVKGIKYTVTKDGFLCPFGGTGAKTGAEYLENSAVTVKPVSGGTDITID